MKVPGFLLLKPVQIALAGLSIIGAVALWFKAHDNNVRERDRLEQKVAATQEALERQVVVTAAKDDTLRTARANTDTVKVYLQSAAASYNRQRAGVNTSAPQPAGVPAGSVVVPIAFVESADSLARMVPILLATIEVERIASQRRIAAGDSTIRLLETQNAQLRLAIEAAKPGITDKIKWAGYGGAAVALGMMVLGNRGN